MFCWKSSKLVTIWLLLCICFCDLLFLKLWLLYRTTFCLVVAHCSGKDHFEFKLQTWLKTWALRSHTLLRSVFSPTDEFAASWYSSSPQNALTCLLNSGPAKFFVNRSASLSSDLIHLITINPCSLSSRRKYWPTSTCLVRPPVTPIVS